MKFYYNFEIGENFDSFYLLQSAMAYILKLTLLILLSACITFALISLLTGSMFVNQSVPAHTVIPSPPTQAASPTPSPTIVSKALALSPTHVPTPKPQNPYPVHRSINATVFWIGENASADNGYIPNQSSAWDLHWMERYGGIDTPYQRNSYYPYHPQDFVPQENPFYVALPYNDFGAVGHKDNITQIYWYTQNFNPDHSFLKNTWIKVTYQQQTCYGQWQDVGPYLDDDINYVFGDQSPAYPESGIDLSPALRVCLRMPAADKVDWQFVPQELVPSGPWLDTVTTSQTNWTP